MEVKFIKCTASKLNSVPIVDGQILVLTDNVGMYYDMAGARTPCCANGTATLHGIVKLSDKYTSSAGSAAGSVGASSKAVYDCYTTLNTKINSVKKSTQFFSGSATKASSSTNTVFDFSDFGFAISALPTGTQGDVFMCDVLFTVNPSSGTYAGKIYKGNLVWTYTTSKGWTIYQYSSSLYYNNQVWVNTGTPWTSSVIQSDLSITYLGRLAVNVKPTTAPDPQPGYTVVMTLHNAIHFNGTTGALYSL